MTTNSGIPPWPAVDPSRGGVRLRRFRDGDAGMAIELSRDPYVPTVGSLPARATHGQALVWLERQRHIHVGGSGFSFAVADAETDRCVGEIGLWGWALEQGRAQAGYGVIPSARGRRIAATALLALLDFAWSIPALHRVELYIEPWNIASIRTAEYGGFHREGLLRSYQEIAGERRDMLLYAAVRNPALRSASGQPIDSPAGTPRQ